MAALQGHERAAYVRRMFERIARRYDRMNRLITFGRDRVWRRYVIAQAGLTPAGRLLDVATGTGDIALEALDRYPGLEAVGVDFAPMMMIVGRGRAGGARVRWCHADALALPFADGAFDAVTSGYLMRNVIDVEAAFREQVRVVRPGGRVVCLDTTPPPRSLLRPFILFHLRVVIPLLGRLVAGDSAAYSYLPESTERFRTPEELAEIMSRAGLVEIRHRRFMLGTMAVHVGSKAEGSP